MFQFQRVAIIGASRGLGAGLLRVFQQRDAEILAIARKIESFQTGVQTWSADVARTGMGDWLQVLAKFNPELIIYSVGGGPFGDFASKAWKDHEWALRVTGLFPMELVHALGQQKPQALRQVCLVGSAIAESSPDPGASSYSAAKHLLLGFFKSARAESKLPFDLRMYSPGYMDTELLPPSAWPRKEPGLVKKVEEVALDLATWCSHADDEGYRSYK